MNDPGERSRNDGGTRSLVARAAAGDVGAFRQLLEEVGDRSFRVAAGLLQDPDEAEDAVQEAFIRAWEAIGRLDGDVVFTTWLHRIVVNVSYDRIRARSRRTRLFAAIDRVFGGDEPPGDADPSSAVERSELRDAIARLARRLPPKQYLVFNLRDILDQTVEETAESTGLSVNAVKVHLCLARKKMRQWLEPLRENQK